MLVWLSHAPQPDLSADAPAVDRWHAGGNPFVVCRQRGAEDDLAIGFCLATPSLRPRRIAAQSIHDHIARIARPPSLKEIAAARRNPEQAAAGCRDHAGALAQLSAAAANAGLDIRVFGSWMWQTLTGDPHVSSDSDLDLLIDVSTAAEADRAAALLQTASADSPLRVDGEFSISGKGEVHWREYLTGGPELLIKSIATVRMIRRDDLWK
ncbi:MAG: malonate decarboxylase holo-[acyl-carrier-protein] synthase [Verrucomicrobiaceae bacterium]|nr:MAG: malonate decarboxylase holo-[acyl-carrier-protein] synthase [Verrucomicrobiaceae bacterium]